MFHGHLQEAFRAKLKPKLKLVYTLVFQYSLKLLFGQHLRAGQPLATPRRLLLLNPTHLGDIVISTSLLGVLKSAYPNVEIGFATASWSHSVVRDHPLITYTHVIDHWRMSREHIGLFSKLIRYRKTAKRALREIRTVNYDVAICLNNGSIDLLNLAWKADIRERVAFSGSLWLTVATKTAHYPGQNLFLHQGACQAELLRTLGIQDCHFAFRKSSLAPSGPTALKEVCDLLGVASLETFRYSVIHMGAGVPFKERPPDFWREVASTLSPDQTVLFTGKGAREHQNIERAIAGLPNCVNACGRLSWAGFVSAIRHADCLYGVDSMAGHVASAVGTKSVTVSHGAAGPARWRPEGRNTTVWTNPVDCSPCGKANGCGAMDCFSGIPPQLVVSNSNYNVATAFNTLRDGQIKGLGESKS